MIKCIQTHRFCILLLHFSWNECIFTQTLKGPKAPCALSRATNPYHDSRFLPAPHSLPVVLVYRRAEHDHFQVVVWTGRTPGTQRAHMSSQALWDCLLLRTIHQLVGTNKLVCSNSKSDLRHGFLP